MTELKKHVSVAKEIHSLDNLIKRFLDKQSNKIDTDFFKVSSNGRIIGYLFHNDGKAIYQRDIEKEFCITRSTASKVLSLMEQKGLIERKSVSCDARLRQIILTDRSREISALMRKDLDKAEAALTSEFSSDEIELLYSFIDRMKKNVQI